MKIIADTELDGVVILDDNFEVVTSTTLKNFGEVLSSSSSINTGLIPQNTTGILSYKKHGDKTQIAYQIEAGYIPVKWGEYERDTNQVVVNLAHPYKIFVVDYDKDLLVGLRHFASPEPIYSLDDPLYHLPLPNTNCRGYGETSVGWVCLYRTDNKPLLSLQEKIHYAYERESGLHEPYNNANMSGTDGPRFYNARKIPHYGDPATWIAKTEKEGGPDWVLKEGMLIPIKVAKDGLAYEHSDKGIPYTMGMAINEPYLPYYRGRLKAEEIAFYEKGWDKNQFSKIEFDAKTLNKLQLLEAPKNLNVAELINSIRPSEVKLLDFNVWVSATKKELSKAIFSMKRSCCFCGQIHSSLEKPENQVIPFFYNVITLSDIPYQYITNTDGLKKNMVYYKTDMFEVIESAVSDHQDNNEDAEEDWDYSSYFPNESTVEDYYACDNCIHSDYTITAYFGDDAKHKQVLTAKGKETLYNTNSKLTDTWDRYSAAFYDDIVTSAEVSSYAIKIKENNNYKIIPESDFAECVYCLNRYPLEHDSNFFFMYPSFLSVTAQESSGLLKFNPVSYFQALKISKCPQCTTKVSHLFHPTEIIAIPKTPIPLKETQAFQAMGNIDYYLKLDCSIKSILEPHSKADLISTKLDFSLNYYCAIIYLNGSPYFTVDTLDNYQALFSCKCGLTLAEPKDNNTCDHCLDKDNNYVKTVTIN